MEKEEKFQLPQVARREIVPAQDHWVRKAERVNGPISGFWFRFQAKANTQALKVEKERVAAARELMREYGGLFAEIRAAQEAATAVHARRELAEDFFDEEVAHQQEAIDEARHRRVLATRRREKEAIEAETRRIEALHEQEAVGRFKEEKFQVGFARFRAKLKEHLVGVASAEAAIAETKPGSANEGSTNVSEEIAALQTLLRQTQRSIDEGEMLGRNTQALRERLDMYQALLVRVQGRDSGSVA